MAKEQVQAITKMEEDFAQWYTDIVKKAELVDYSSVKRMYDSTPVRLCLMGKYAESDG